MNPFSSLFKSQPNTADPFEKAYTPSLSMLPCLGAIIGDTVGSKYEYQDVAGLIDELKDQGVMFVFMGTNQNVELVSTTLHIDNYKVFDYSIEGMKDAWRSEMEASTDYYDRMSQYNKETRYMSREERNNYYRDRNKEDGWF